MCWEPITDLPPDFRALASDELRSLGELWRERAHELEGTGALLEFVARLQRRWAIETGLIERLYTLDRGITQLLVEQGIDAALIPHAAAGRDSEWVASIIGDQLDVAEGLFAFVKQDRELSAGYIRELHQALTRNPETTTARTPAGRLIEVPLRRGEFKQQPDNPIRPDGVVHEYAPPEQVASEVDRLVSMHAAHRAQGVPPEIEAAWLHHRFTQIHPFQDGNGRVARALATLVFLRAGWFPPVIRDEEDRSEYIAALESADRGELRPLVELFARVEKSALLGAIGLSAQVIDEQRDMGQLISALAREAARRPGQVEEGERAGRARRLASSVLAGVGDRMGVLRDQLLEALGGGHYRVFHDVKAGDEAEAAWYRADVIDLAHEFGYYANFEAFRGWARLKLVDVRAQLQDEIVVAVHGVGRQFRGGLSAVAVSIRREPAEDGRRTTLVVPLTKEPFSFTYGEDEPAVLQRLSRWLEPALLVGIDAFRRAIANGA